MNIEWMNRPRRSGLNGRRAQSNMLLFTIDWSSIHDKDEDPWVLRCTLPGYERKEWRAKTSDELKRQAEEIFKAWLRYTRLQVKEN